MEQLEIIINLLVLPIAIPPPPKKKSLFVKLG